VGVGLDMILRFERTCEKRALLFLQSTRREAGFAAHLRLGVEAVWMQLPHQLLERFLQLLRVNRKRWLAVARRRIRDEGDGWSV
jgi:hypothetical protein